MNIAILGAGGVGAGLGQALAKQGHDIRFGVRILEKAAEAVAKCHGKAQATTVPEAAAFGDVVFLAVPWQAALPVVEAAGDLSGKILVDCTNPIGWEGGPIMAAEVAGTSGGQLVAEKTAAKVVKAFNTHGLELNLAPRVGGTAVDAYLCGDDADARATVAGLAEEIGFHPVDVGPLRNAAATEHLAVLWIHLAMIGGAGRKIAFKLVRD